MPWTRLVQFWSTAENFVSKDRKLLFQNLKVFTKNFCSFVGTSMLKVFQCHCTKKSRKLFALNPLCLFAWSMKSKHFHNFWDYFFFKKTVWDVLWKFDRPAKFSSEKGAAFCSKSEKTGSKLQKQKEKILFGKIPRTLKKKNFDKHQNNFRSNFKNDTEKDSCHKHPFP